MHSTSLGSSRNKVGFAIFWGGLTCGAMDITAAFVVYGWFGARPMLILKGIAAGLLGLRAFQGGLAVALLGLGCHFLIAFSAAAVYVAFSRKFDWLINQAIVFGILYGIAVYFFMNRVVVRLAGARKYPFSLEMMLIGVVIHIFCVGLPIALMARRYLRS